MVLSVTPLTNIHLLCLSTLVHTGGVNLRNEETRAQLLKGDCFAALDQGAVFGAAGVMPLWKGVGHGWAVLAVPTGRRRLLFFTREARRYLEVASKWHRIQTTVCEDFGQGLCWAAHLLGFAPEGTLAKYDEHGRTHFMMARVR